MKLLFLASVLVYIIGQLDEINEIVLEKIHSIEIIEEYNQQDLNISGNYITWIELYTNTFHVYNISTKEEQLIELKKGKGPGEVTWIRASTIHNDNLVIYDYAASKLLFYGLKNGEFIKEIVTSKLLQSLTSFDGKLIVTSVSRDGYFFEYDINGNTLTPLKNSSLNVLNSFNVVDPNFNPYRIQGTYSTYQHGILFGLSFEPIIFIYDLKKSTLERFKYENIPDVDYESGREGNMLRSPRPLLMYTDKIVGLKNNKVGILGRGKSNNRNYSHQNIHIFDLDSKKYFGTIKTDNDISTLATSSDYLVTLSKESWTIDIYKYTYQ